MEALKSRVPAWMTEDLVLLEEQARRFLARRARAACRAAGPRTASWSARPGTSSAQAGLLCAGIPEEYGGAGGTFAHETVINREFALAGLDAIGAPLHSGIVAPYILNYGTEEQKKRWLPQLATGELVGAIAMTRARHRLRPAGRAHHARRSPATATCSTAPRPSSPTASTPT